MQEFADDNIQYAEIRPNFMVTNQVMSDDGKTKINNWEIMELIINGYNEFQKGITREDKVYQAGHGKKTLMGLKVIYCTPRSFDPDMVRESLEECLAFKKDPKFAPFIAGTLPIYCGFKFRHNKILTSSLAQVSILSARKAWASLSVLSRPFFSSSRPNVLKRKLTSHFSFTVARPRRMEHLRMRTW